MRTMTTLIIAGALAATAGVGAAPAVARADARPAATAKASAGTRIVLGRSEFGRMLFDSRRQAIYIFQRDPRGRRVCYGACAAAWPPVQTRGRPVAGRGVRAS